MLLDDLEILLLALCIVLVYFLVIRHLHGGSLACIPGPPSPSGIFGEQELLTFVFHDAFLCYDRTHC